MFWLEVMRTVFRFFEETTKRFPYFSAAQVLLAKEYWQADHLDKQSQLEKASLRVADRAFLYNLLHNEVEISRREQIEVAREPDVAQTEPILNCQSRRSVKFFQMS